MGLHVKRQTEQTVSVACRVRQDAKLKVTDSYQHVFLTKRSFPFVCLMAISEREPALISSLASVSCMALRSFREIRSGESTAQMNVAVSRNRRKAFASHRAWNSATASELRHTQVRPSRKASASSSVIGFHQSGLLMTTRPWSVPNLGLSVDAALVRTRSTTGVPPRQIVTGSPLPRL